MLRLRAEANGRPVVSVGVEAGGDGWKKVGVLPFSFFPLSYIFLFHSHVSSYLPVSLQRKWGCQHRQSDNDHVAAIHGQLVFHEPRRSSC